MPDTTKGPFPFKGKGGSDWSIASMRKRVEQLQQQRESTLRRMRALIEDYEASFGSKLSAYLVMHKTANGQYLRWRLSSVKQRYFAIAGDEIGKAFLLSHSQSVRSVLVDIEQSRLRLNLVHGALFYEIRSVKKLISQLIDLHELAKNAPVNLYDSNI